MILCDRRDSAFGKSIIYGIIGKPQISLLSKNRKYPQGSNEKKNPCNKTTPADAFKNLVEHGGELTVVEPVKYGVL
jgi:hypothetical protein